PARRRRHAPAAPPSPPCPHWTKWNLCNRSGGITMKRKTNGAARKKAAKAAVETVSGTQATEPVQNAAAHGEENGVFERRLARHYDELKWLYCELYHNDMG